MAKTKDEGRSEGTYASILADGKIHIKVADGTEGAVGREYEDSEGNKGTKTELVYKDIAGMITGVKFEDGKYGLQMLVTILEEDEEAGTEETTILAFGTESNYGEDMMKKLPNINLKKMVKIAPYSFKDEKGKNKRGVTVFQDGDKKIVNFFYDPVKKVNLYDFPEIPKAKGKVISKKEWKKHFSDVSDFLVEYNTELFKTDADKKFDAHVSTKK
jgi:hypothetical protein